MAQQGQHQKTQENLAFGWQSCLHPRSPHQRCNRVRVETPSVVSVNVASSSGVHTSLANTPGIYFRLACTSGIFWRSSAALQRYHGRRHNCKNTEQAGIYFGPVGHLINPSFFTFFTFGPCGPTCFKRHVGHGATNCQSRDEKVHLVRPGK